jgi:CHAD domain-containing protein
MAAFRRRIDLLETRLRRFIRMLPGVNAGDVRAVHRTRVASRRLREVLPVLQLDAPTADRLMRRLRKLTRRLGRVRELDVLHLLIDELHESRRYPSRALDRIKDEVAVARKEASTDLANREIGEELRKLSRKLERRLGDLNDMPETTADCRALRWAIDARVTRRAAALKAAIGAAGNVYLPERLHAVRIAVKKLRYGVELATEAAGASNSADLRMLKRSQDLLGRTHDLQILIDRVRQVQGSLTPPDVIAWRELDAVVAGLETSCRRLHARYVRDRGALLALCDRLGARTPAERRASTRKAG